MQVLVVQVLIMCIPSFNVFIISGPRNCSFTLFVIKVHETTMTYSFRHLCVKVGNTMMRFSFNSAMTPGFSFLRSNAFKVDINSLSKHELSVMPPQIKKAPEEKFPCLRGGGGGGGEKKDLCFVLDDAKPPAQPPQTNT